MLIVPSALAAEHPPKNLSDFPPEDLPAKAVHKEIEEMVHEDHGVADLIHELVQGHVVVAAARPLWDDEVEGDEEDADREAQRDVQQDDRDQQSSYL